MESHDLIGKVAAERLSGLLDPPPPSRVLYGVLGLSPEVTCAIAREVASLTVSGGRIDVCVHPDLARAPIGSARVSAETATYHRNHADPDVLLTLFSVPAKDVKSVEQSLSHTDRIDDEWLFEDMKPWVAKAMPDADEGQRDHLAAIVRGLIRSGAGFDAHRVAGFVVRLVSHHENEGLALANAARRALPALRLPRDAGDPRAKLTESAEAELFFRRLQEEVKPALHLQDKDGEPLPRTKIRKRLQSLKEGGQIPDENLKALEDLILDQHVGDGGWTTSQEKAAEIPWEVTSRVFVDDRRREKLTFGEETRLLFDKKFPKTLRTEDIELLDDLKSDASRPKEAYDKFFSDHREKLRVDPKLYRRWEKLVFRKPIETADLAEGLLRLVERARPDSEEDKDKVLLVRLEDSDDLDFWTKEKNTKLCRVLRDRWRGLDELVGPDVRLEFGRCWSENWEAQIPAGVGEVDSTGKDAVQFFFKAFAVPRATPAAGSAGVATAKALRAQMIWTPPPEAMITAFPLDLEVLAPGQEPVPLLTARVSANRYDRHGSIQAVDLAKVTTIIDVEGASDGRLADPRKRQNRVDENWRDCLDQAVANNIVEESDATTLRAAFDTFQAEYTRAIRAMKEGRGLADDALLMQAQRYGELFRALASKARASVCVRDLWAPLLTIGAASLDGFRPGVIVTPWHPLRLAEIAVKARHLADGIRRVINSSASLAAEVPEYVDNLCQVLSRTYYADVGAAPGTPNVFVAETRQVADVSLLEPQAYGSEEGLADEPAEETVAAFERVVKEYLDLRPHEKASFSTVVMDAESEDLPVLMAESMARRIDGDPTLRCDLVLTHENVGSLRRIYERQNRRIGYEVDASLTSEAARNFLSRLRVAIVNQALLDQVGPKGHDIVVLQDVIARRAEVKWTRATGVGTSDMLTHMPTAHSRRKPFHKGDTTSGSYLTTPGGPSPFTPTSTRSMMSWRGARPRRAIRGCRCKRSSSSPGTCSRCYPRRTASPTG
ncbi:MAG: hypothetical protein HC900_01505 [Methylacidiphilales bacterium]|nr:hypothetical protein [Candidatus Methylacidiphilales bacterium]